MTPDWFSWDVMSETVWQQMNYGCDGKYTSLPFKLSQYTVHQSNQIHLYYKDPKFKGYFNLSDTFLTIRSNTCLFIPTAATDTCSLTCSLFSGELRDRDSLTVYYQIYLSYLTWIEWIEFTSKEQMNQVYTETLNYSVACFYFIIKKVYSCSIMTVI